MPAPAYINQTDSSFAATASTTYSHTVTADTSLLVVCAQCSDTGSAVNPAISVATYGGVNLTLAGATQSNNSNNRHSTALYYMLNPPVGAANVVTTWDQAVVQGRTQAMNVSGANKFDSNGTDNVVTPLQVGLNTTGPSFMVGTLTAIRAGATTFTWSADVVEVQDTQPNTNFFFATGYRHGAAAESYTFTATPSATLLTGALCVGSWVGVALPVFKRRTRFFTPAFYRPEKKQLVLPQKRSLIIPDSYKKAA